MSESPPAPASSPTPEPSANPSEPPSLEGPLTLEDIALVADGADSLPIDTKRRLQQMVLHEERYRSPLAQLDAMAREAGLPASQDRLGTALLVHEQYQRLQSAESWQHPAEVLDPEGTLGLLYEELLHVAQSREPEGSEILRKLEDAWIQEKSRADLTNSLVDRLLEFDPTEAELLLRRVKLELWLGIRDRRAAEESA